jgi:hypothetical protein
MGRLTTCPRAACFGIWATVVLIALVRHSQAGPGVTAPTIKPDAAAMQFDDLGLYRVGYRYDQGKDTDLPMGWSGHFHEPTGISCQAFGTQNGRSAFLLHAPWRGGTGSAYQEFAFAVPRVRRVLLRGAIAMKSDIVGRSDGATFRVIVNGRTMMERHRTDGAWSAFEVDVTRVAVPRLVVRFETDPGPKRDASFDYALWSSRTVVFEGLPSSAESRPTPPALDLRRMLNAVRHGVAPSNGYAYRTEVSVRDERARLRYAGADGVVEYVWSPRAGDLGSWRVNTAMRGGRAHSVGAMTGATVHWTGPVTVDRTRLSRSGSAARCIKEVRIAGQQAKLTLTATLVGKALKLQVRCDAPVVASLDIGAWGPVLRRRDIPVPYYGTVRYASMEGLFLNTYLDWTASRAAAHVGSTATYPTRTDGTRNLMAETGLWAPAWHLAETLPNIPNPASPFRADVGARVVLDVWGGRYADIARKLEGLHRLGLRHCTVLIHDWQRSGYDNALPMHLPAAADKGGDTDMRPLVATAARLGFLIALHENYVDYYPNYDHFDERHIALDPAGKRVPAWYNPGTKIQSFAVQPNAILPLAQSQSAEINRRFGTNACYLDVHSAVPPWFHVDHRAGESGSGTFAQVREAHRALFAYERTTHGGPVFGEGNSHWYWSGMLDGVEAQFGTGWPGNAGQSAPLMPDFNLLKVHPLQINHGQGYYERWWDNLPWGATPPMAVLDQYRVQEVVYGHTGFLGASTWSREPLAWLEHHLLTPVTARHARTTVRAISYHRAEAWIDATAAAKAGDWSRPRVVYANGLTIIANNAKEPWRAHGATLPQHGWIAHGAGVTAYTALRDGVVCDYSETADRVFANARPAKDWNTSGVLAVTPSVGAFRQTGPRRFTATYAWRVAGPIPDDYGAFVHFSVPTPEAYDEGIRFQQDHALPDRTSQWAAGSITDGPHTIELPADLADGVYTWTTGLYRPDLGRPALEAPSDRSGRAILGTLTITGNGSGIAFQPDTSGPTRKARSYLAHLNTDDRIVTFSTVRTNGSVLIRRERDDWVLVPYPTTRPFALELHALRFACPATVRTEGGSATEVRPTRRGTWWRLPLNGAGTYRWRAKSP